MTGRKFLLPILLLGLLLGGLWLGPKLVDQATLRDWVTPQLQRGLRQTVSIDGNIDLSLLPRPAMVVERLRVTRQGRDIATLPRVEASLQLWPLLVGRLQPDEVRLTRPDIQLAPFAAPFNAAVHDSDPTPTAPVASPPVIDARTPIIGRLIIEQGRLSFGDPARLTLAPLDLTLLIEESETRLNAHLVWHGTGYALIAALRKSEGEATLHVDGGGDLHWNGRVDAGGPSLQGKLSGKIDDLSRISGAFPNLPASLTADLGSSAGDVEIKDITLSLGDGDYSGNAHISAGTAPRLALALHGNRLNLDRLSVKQKRPPVPILAAPSDGGGAAAPAPEWQGLTTEFSLAIDQLLWRGKILQDAKLNLLVEKGEIAIKQANITLPGNSDVSLLGVIAPGPAFSGSFDAKSDDLRQLLHWAGIEPANIPADRLHAARLAGEIKAVPELVSLEKVRLKLDSSQIDLAATYRTGPQPALGISFAIDLLNADAYWPSSTKQVAPLANPENPSAPASTQPVAESASGSTLAADINGHIGKLMWRGLALQDVVLDAGWSDQVLNVKTLSVAEVAGARFSMHGHVVRADGGFRFEAAEAELYSKDLERSLRSFAVELPLSMPVDLTAELNGPVNAPQMALSAPQLDFGKVRLQAPKANLSLAGDVVTLDHLSAGLYGGQLSGEGRLVRSDGSVNLHLMLNQAQMRQALLDVADVGLADGVMQGELNLNSVGHFPNERIAHLAGTASLLVKDGQIKGFDLKSADRALAARQGIGGLLLLLQAGLTGGSTHFSSLSGTARIEAGVIRSDDLKLVAEGGGAVGAARIDLPADSIDSHADFHFASATDAPPLVMRMTGSLQSPHRFLDVKPLQQWLADHGVKTGKPKDVLKSLLPGIIK